jgi:hypothetical protein
MRTVRAAAALVAAVVCGVPAAAAQSRPRYPAVFAGAVGSGSNAGEGLDLSMTLTEVYDDNLLADAGASTPSPLQTSGAYTALAPQFNLHTRGRRLQFGVNGGSNYRHYPSLSQTVATSHNVAAGFSARLMGETSLVVNQTVSYAPADLYGLFTSPSTPAFGEPTTVATDYQTNSIRSYTYLTDATIDHAVTARTSISVDGSVRHTDFGGNIAGFSDVRSSAAAGHLVHSVNRGVDLRLGYTYRQAHYSALLQTTEHDLEIGIDYARALSPTRRLTFGFNLGPTVAEVPFDASRPQGAGNHYRVTGDVFVDREIGRSWAARAAYRRGLSYIEALAGPVYTDSASVEAAGFVNRRVDLRLSAAYTTGQITSQQVAAAPFTTYTADARLQVGLSRECAVYVEGLFYEYAFDSSLVIVPGMPSHFRRSGARAGITLWLPVRAGNRAAR